jgi:dipeptidyl aminopeptidase/acylaminoacyl peptidase
MLSTTADDGNPQSDDKLLCSSDRVAAVVAWCPPTELRPWVDPESSYYKKFPALHFDPKKAADCSPVLHASKDDPPTLMIHGDKDTLVPIEHSQRMLAELKAKGAASELLVLPGAEHGFRGDDQKRAMEAMVGWFEKYLAKK